ncbi:MAG: hypothetical protein V7763_03605 [Sulfitobacter sp.]
MDSGEKLSASEKMIVAIISTLAQRGVLRKDIIREDLNLSDEHKDADLFVDAVSWLSNEGVIHSSYEHKFLLSGDAALGFTLTSKGYQLLESDFQGTLTLGRAIKQVNETGKSFTNAGDFVGGILGGFTKSISS